MSPSSQPGAPADAGQPTAPEGRGYVLDEPYTARYFDLQSPARMRHSMRCAGFDPATPIQGFRYAELGCGNGATLAMLAALHPDSSFLGIDLNPAHIAAATALAQSAGLDNLMFLQADIAQACAMPWGAFDYITAHGVYAWVDAEVRDSLLRFIGRHLAPQGVAYVSYNALPGWSAKEPLWRLLDHHIADLPGGSVARVGEGLRFLEFLRDAGVPYFAQNPAAGAHLEMLRAEDPRYVAHEFCNRHFAPLYCSTLFADARRQGLVFVAQAETQPNLPFERVPPACLDYLARIADFEEREVASSLLRNDGFRTDLYMRAWPAAVDLEDSPLWDQAFTTLTPLRDIPAELVCGSRRFHLSDELVDAITEGCAAGRLTMRELAALPRLRRHSPRLVLETALLLELSRHYAFLTAPAPAEDGPLPECWRLAPGSAGVLLASRLRENGFGHLAAPRLGSAIRLDVMASLAVLCLAEPDADAPGARLADWLNRDWPALLAFRVTESWAGGFLDDFRAHWGPVLRKLGVIGAR
ncbi:MAG: class I SAM-dependent methyltransferase [Betaproteobacteria bacterium]|nr:class I SAM-dependent methyltransferase [Betaproteobacteria bacterium]